VRYRGVVATDEEDARRRRIGIALIALVAALFIVELIALATGAIVVALVCAAALTVGWFVFRSATRRGGR
jgi:hypothetical protein